jgi:hypothetical protein
VIHPNGVILLTVQADVEVDGAAMRHICEHKRGVLAVWREAEESLRVVAQGRRHLTNFAEATILGEPAGEGTEDGDSCVA